MKLEASARTPQSTGYATQERVHGASRISGNKIPKSLSPGEETFALQCKAYGLTPVREYQFHPSRKWAFDFCWPEKMIAVEIEGGTSFGKSRHSRGAGFEGDCSKYNAAVRLGWRVFRYSTAMVKRAEAIDDMRGLL